MATILIVDDLAVNRMSIKLSLKSEGYDFFEASNGVEAIDMAKKHNPDIILMDAMMPLMDGFEATKIIRKIEEIQRIPILMITSLESKEDKIKALNCGVNDFINKSFDKSELKARCHAYIELANLNKKYILATKNIVSNLPNKMKLLKDIQSSSTKRALFLIEMDNYNDNENFYGLSIAEDLEKVFINYLIKDCLVLHDHYQLYHIASGKYGILFNETFDNNKDNAENFCANLISSIKHHNFQYHEYNFDINVTMSYMYGLENLYEDANTMLNLAQKEKLEFMVDIKRITQLKNSIKDNLEILKTIKQALQENKIEPFYQPIYNNHTDSINRYEALIRMYDNHGNIIFPHPIFLNVAKQGKLYPYVTRLLIEKVLNKIRKEGCEISINISSLDIEDKIMQAFILDAFERNRDITNKLIVELLEDKETNSYEEVNKFIKILKSYDIKIAIDDFGSGYSNFIRIVEFEPDIIKIDGSLICDIATSQASRQTVETVKIFADKIGAKVVAEYVENEEIFNIIKDLGIDYSQGYYIGKAEPKIRKTALFKESLETV